MVSLRVGLIYDGSTLARWQLLCLHEMQRIEGVSLVLHVIDDRPAPLGGRGKEQPRPARALSGIITAAPSLTRVELEDLTHSIPSCKLSDRAAIADASLDCLLDFAEPPVADVADLARHGVWGFSYSAPGTRETGIPFFRALRSGGGIVFSRLYVRMHRQNVDVTLRDACVTLTAYRYTAEVERTHRRFVLWLTQTFRQIVAGALNVCQLPSSAVKDVPAVVPSLLDLALIRLNVAVSIASALANLVRQEKWHVGTVSEPVDRALAAGFTERVAWLPELRRHGYIADPFPYTENEQLYIFCEYYDYRTRRGHISYIAVGHQSTNTTVLKRIIESGYHMSYPYILEHAGAIYCIPETYEARKVLLYVADAFPDRWRLVGPLLEDFPGVDSTIVQHDGRWWLFCTNHDHDPSSELCIFFADDLLGSWTPHPLNPVKTDVRSSRPAGAPFIHEGALYRPAQDCSLTYGGRLTLNRVVRLNETEFQEEPVGLLEPLERGPYPAGLHTLSSSGSISVVDGKKYVFDRYAIVSTLNHYFWRAVARLSVLRTPRENPDGSRAGP